MRDYVRGLLGQTTRKNGWQLAEWAGHRTPDGFQRLLNSSVWDTAPLRNDVRAYVAEQLGPDGVLIIDDTGFIKKGTTSARVGRQYTGTSGKIDNCQIGVFAAYATRSGRALVDRELYLPKAWTSDRDRCRAAKIPDERGFATKGELARNIVRRCLATGLPATWLTADEAYGQDWQRPPPARATRRRLCGGGAQVAADHVLTGIWRIDELIDEAPGDAWQRLSCGDGAKGSADLRLGRGQAAANLIFHPDPPTRHRWVMARRSLSNPEEVAYYLAYAPAGVEIAELAQVAGSRWAIEECFQAAKNECGLDEYEVRRYPGWYRHITLAMLAHAPPHRARHPGRRGRKGGCRNGSALVPLTVAEIRRLLDTPLPRPRADHDPITHALKWSAWRRRRQAVARRCHYRKRSSRHEPLLEY
ncbi:IS701 family transposase [Streptomyces werraensis]|uniref:IS701 family transposase n=1 Tax=Streptomyces werraensis TaxID=68284 RepID=A0ABV3JNA8_9ACTN